MKSKNSRLDAIKIIISSKEVGSQEELLQELAKEGVESGEGSQYERKLCICITKQYHVQTYD